MSADRCFWMVWREGTSAPLVKHPDRASAYNEACRLAERHPGHRFIVLEAIGDVLGTVLVTQQGFGPPYDTPPIVTPPLDWDPKTGRIHEGPQG